MVDVYKTPGETAAMYDYFRQHVLAIGGNLGAFNMVRKGRVIYRAETAPRPDPSAPPVPTKDFQSFVKEVAAPLPAHPRGSTPAL